MPTRALFVTALPSLSIIETFAKIKDLSRTISELSVTEGEQEINDDDYDDDDE